MARPKIGLTKTIKVTLTEEMWAELETKGSYSEAIREIMQNKGSVNDSEIWRHILSIKEDTVIFAEYKQLAEKSMKRSDYISKYCPQVAQAQ